MCGRFTNRYDQEAILRLYRVTAAPGAAIPNTPARYNIAPTQIAPVIRLREASREQAFLKWGLVPSFASDLSVGPRMINARAETVSEKPAFRSAFLKRRCLVVADGFYEWKREGKDKQPYFITLKDNAVFAFAGLWEMWRPRNGGAAVETFTILTTEPNALVAPLHDRMPVILAPESWPVWLGETPAGHAEIQALLQPFPAEHMECWKVAPKVGNVRNDEADLMQPIG